MVVSSALFHTWGPYIHVGRAGPGGRGWVPWARCQVCAAGDGQASPQPKTAPRMANSSPELILWLFQISQQQPPYRTSCWFLPESKAGLSASSSSYFGEVRDWYLQQRPWQRAHKPLRSADCEQVIKVQHLLKGCAGMELALALQFWGRSCGMMLLGQELWDDAPGVLSSPQPAPLRGLWAKKGTGSFYTLFYTALYTAHLYYMTWK